jgi:hypothetical protein
MSGAPFDETAPNPPLRPELDRAALEERHPNWHIWPLGADRWIAASKNPTSEEVAAGIPRAVKAATAADLDDVLDAYDQHRKRVEALADGHRTGEMLR